MSNTDFEATLACAQPEEPLSTICLPDKLVKTKSNPRPKNLRLFTGMKPHQMQVAQKNKNQSESDNFNAPPILLQKSFINKEKALFKELISTKDDSNNIGSSVSTEETMVTPIVGDDFGESCQTDEINQIDEHDALEAKIHKWLDEQHIYITDPREKRDQYYQKLKLISCKISQLQSSIYLQNEDEKTNGGSIDTLDGNCSHNLAALTTSTIPQFTTINDLPMQLNILKIENSPLLLRRSSNTTKKIQKSDDNNDAPKYVNTCGLISSPNSKNYKKSSIFRSSEPTNKLGSPNKDIKVVPFPFDELEEDEKKNSLSIREMSSVSIDLQEMCSIVCDSSNSNNGL